MSTKKDAFIKTAFSDFPIVIETMTDEGFTFISDSEFPLNVPLFMEDSEQVAAGMIRMKNFEIIESQRFEHQYRYQAVFRKNKFNFEEWEKTHKKS